MSDNFDAFTNPNSAVINGSLTVKSDSGSGNTSVSFDNGAIVSSGFGDLIVSSITTTEASSSIANVIGFGARGNGTNDDTTPIQNAINSVASAGGIVFFPAGTYKISAPLLLSSQRIMLLGSGIATAIQAASGFVGASMIAISADYASIKRLKIVGGPNNSSASNPAIVGVSASAARYAIFTDLRFYYVNGWSIESIGGASVNNVGYFMNDIHMEHCAQGVHMKGVSGSNYVGQAFLSGIHPEVIDNGDGILLEDINDIEIVNINGAVAGGAVAGNMLHIKGNCASIFVSNVDLGAIAQSSVSAAILIESSANGSPSNVVLASGVVQKCLNGISITDGSNIICRNMTFKSSYTDGASVSGATVGTPLIFDGCVFQTNNQSNGTCYDINLSHSTGFSHVRGCNLQSPVGSGAGNVTNPANDTNHRAYFFLTHFSGTGTTPSNCFSSGTPQIVRSCPGYNPRGSITPAAIGASPFTGNASQNDISIVFTAIGGMSDFKIGGVSLGLPVANTSYRVPARQTFTITHNGTPPTYQWYAD